MGSQDLCRALIPDDALGESPHPYMFSNRTLDLSFNNFRHPPILPSFKNISTLYLVQNKISKVDSGDLDWASGSMKSLELGGNRLRAIEGLEGMTRMEELWLGKNKIRKLEVI